MDQPNSQTALPERVDVVVVGGGIVGLATAMRLLELRPDVSVVILERETELATHQTARNSGVVHAGLYYPPGSLKARLCREGKQDLEAFCERKSIPLERCGKLVVAVDREELPRLAALIERAQINEVPDLEIVGPERIREIEPHAIGTKGLWSPSTGIVDYRRVALAMADHVRALGGVICTSTLVTSIAKTRETLVVGTLRGQLRSSALISCAGLWSDQVASLSTDTRRSDVRIIPFRGDYYVLKPEARRLVRALLYPVPDPRFPFLGVHFTRRIDGAVWAGPNAVVALARTGYRRRDFSWRDVGGMLTYPGFIRLARKYWRTGLSETWRDISKSAFVRELQRYIPEVTEAQLEPGPAGVRAQAVKRNGVLVDDFDVQESIGIMHVRNAPSPAATASLAIGQMLAERAVSRFDL